MGNLKFNGKSTEELGLVIQTPPSYTFPEKDMSSVHVPGRNGDLYIDNKCYKNVDRTYAIAKAFRPGTKLYANTEQILEWLTSANGEYVRLEDDYDDEVYRLAMFNMSNSFVNYFDEATSIDITFNCKPQRFLKTGENVIEYSGSKASIENPTGYYSLPSIELVNVPSEVEDILMMTVSDSKGEDVSNITLNHVGQQDPNNVVVVIDSDDQTVVRKYSDREENVAPYVGLNGLPFPELRDGETIIELKKYESEDTGKIESYDSFMYNKSEKIEGLYKPVERIANEKEKKVLIRSWNTLVAEAKKVNSEAAYQSYALEIAEDYTFASVNDVLDALGQSTMDFSGALSDLGIGNDTYDFVKIEEYEGSDGEWYYKATTKKAGFFMVKGIDGWKTLRYYAQDKPLYSGIKRTTVMSISWYPVADETADVPKIKIDYGEDKPDWLVVNIIQSGADQYYAPQKVEFKTRWDPTHDPTHGSIQSNGYYYKPKQSGISGLLSKATWFKNSSSVVLNSMEWDGSKKKFVSTEGLFRKTDTTYNFKYLKLIGTETTSGTVVWSLPQYKPDKDSKEVIRFTISDKTSSLATLDIKATEDGWYLLSIGDDSDLLNYQYRTAGQSLNSDGVKGTESFKVSFIPGNSTRPDISYANEKDWPDWLDPIPLDINYSTFGTNPAGNAIRFKLANTSDPVKDYINKKYMYHTAVEDEVRNVLEFASPKHITSSGLNIYTIQNDTSEGMVELKADTDFSFYIYQIDEKPTKFDNDRSVVVYTKSGEVYQEYDWTEFNELDPISGVYSGFLRMAIEGTEPAPGSDDEDTRKVEYYANKDGYFKWGTNSAWVYKHAGDELAITTTSIKDDLKIFYMEHLPQYSSEDVPVLFSKVELKPQPEETSEGGENPTSVIIKVKNGGKGYYRVNNNVDWKLYKPGDTILVSKVNETNQIFHLKPKSDTLSNMKIKIKPRWWML